jgi:hypothetical protein
MKLVNSISNFSIDGEDNFEPLDEVRNAEHELNDKERFFKCQI